jgi:dihydrofolate reductase
MKTILVFVTTLDGKITKWGYPIVRSWTSREDQDYFSNLMKNSRLIVTGSNTFNMDPIRPSDNHLLLVMTSHPENYKIYEKPGRLEFTNLSPKELYQHYQADGYDQMVVVGGPHVATSFLKDQLIDELWLTLEPKIFGSGGNLVIEHNLDIRLSLLSCEKVNDAGTLITKYAIIKDEVLNHH